MTKLPVKVLLDENRKPFVPYMTTDTVFYGDTDKTVSETLDAAVKEVTDLSESVEELSKEVNAKIETVFTYKGNVSNYNALQQIVNPNIGDVYNTTDTDKNYAWSGTKWDDLGGIVDLSNYYTKSETEQAISDALKDVEVDVDLSDYYNKAQTDEAISDALAGVEVEVDLSDYYNKTEVDTAISEAIPDIDPSMFLKPKGHVNSEADLPSMGQPSGTTGSYPRTFSTDPTISEVAIPTSSYTYIFGIISSAYHYLYVATEHPEVIKSLAYGSDGSYEIYFEASAEKPVAVYYQRGSTISGAYCIPDSQKDDYYVVRNNQPVNGTEITEPCTLTGYLGGYGQAKIFGNLPNNVKYKTHGYYAYVRNSSGTGNTYTQITDATSDSLTLTFKDNYTYNEGMNMLQFNENYQASWILSDPQEEPNALYTVGPKNEAYISTTDKWIHVSNHDSYTKAEIDAMLGEIESVLDNILNGG